MSTITIIIAIVVLLGGLVGYAVIYQAAQQNKQKRERLHAALVARARNFQYILSALPAGFLPKELLLLVQKSLLDIYTQLVELVPNNENYASSLANLTQQMAQTQKAPAHTPSVSVDPGQFKEIKACLEELYKFVHRLEERKKITSSQGDIYRNMITSLVTKFTIDSYNIYGRQAEASEKHRLAVHYYQLAIKIIEKEGPNSQFATLLTELQAKVAELEKVLSELNLTTPAGDPGDTSSEWDGFGEGETGWKKKQVYD